MLWKLWNWWSVTGLSLNNGFHRNWPTNAEWRVPNCFYRQWVGFVMFEYLMPLFSDKGNEGTHIQTCCKSMTNIFMSSYSCETWLFGGIMGQAFRCLQSIELTILKCFRTYTLTDHEARFYLTLLSYTCYASNIFWF